MKALALVICCLVCVAACAQPKAVVLPEFTYKYQSPKQYLWKKVVEVKSRILFANTIAADDSVVFSFGGFDTLVVQREMNCIVNGRLRKNERFHYPGSGYMFNVFFLRDSFLYLGGGHDSGISRYAYQDFWRYNRKTAEWTRLQDLPFYYRRSVNIFQHRGRIIALVWQLSDAHFETETPVFYAYDEVNDQWRVIGRLDYKNSRPLSRAFIIGSDVFMPLETQAAPIHNMMYRFNLDDLSVSPAAPMPGAVKYEAFAFSDEHYGFVGGGYTADAVYTKSVFRYDPVKDRWEEIRNLPRFIRHSVAWQFGSEYYVGFGINDEPGTLIIWKMTHR